MNKEIQIKVLDRTGTQRLLTIPVDMGLSLMEACKAYELPVEGICGGLAMCATCHCYILSQHKLMDQSEDELAMLDEVENARHNSRLGCQIILSEPLDGLEIELAPELVEEDDWKN